jgi:hypothetical protein
MKKMVAGIFFAMLTGNAMAQAGGASPGASGAGASSAIGATVGMVATGVAAVVGIAASTKSSTPAAANH